MATEIATLKVTDEFSAERCAKSLEFLSPPPPGLQEVRWGRTVEDPKTVMWILNWDSVAAHEEFIKAAIYPSFLDSIKAYCSAPVTFYHTHLQPCPPTKVFEAGVIEVATIAKNPEFSHDQLAVAINLLLDLATKAPGYHSHFQGIKHEDQDIVVLLVGWDSVESHNAFMASESMKEVQAAAGAAAVWEKSPFCHVKLHPQ